MGIIALNFINKMANVKTKDSTLKVARNIKMKLAGLQKKEHIQELFDKFTKNQQQNRN